MSASEESLFSDAFKERSFGYRLRMTLRNSLVVGGGKRVCPGLDPGYGLERLEASERIGTFVTTETNAVQRRRPAIAVT
jgi:hypothetical protein